MCLESSRRQRSVHRRSKSLGKRARWRRLARQQKRYHVRTERIDPARSGEFGQQRGAAIGCARERGLERRRRGDWRRVESATDLCEGEGLAGHADLAPYLENAG